MEVALACLLRGRKGKLEGGSLQYGARRLKAERFSVQG